MTRENAAINAGRGGNDAATWQIPPQGPYCDLDLLTPDDVCALLRVKKSWLYDAVESGAPGRPGRGRTPRRAGRAEGHSLTGRCS